MWIFNTAMLENILYMIEEAVSWETVIARR